MCAVDSLPRQGNVASLRHPARFDVRESFWGKLKPEVLGDKEDNFTSDEVQDAVEEKIFISEAQDAVEEKIFISEAQAEEEQTHALEFLNDIKLDSDNTYSVLLYGFGAIFATYLTSAIVGSLESIPLLPKLMEVVGLGYTLWFTTRYLLFKGNREELKTKLMKLRSKFLALIVIE